MLSLWIPHRFFLRQNIDSVTSLVLHVFHKVQLQYKRSKGELCVVPTFPLLLHHVVTAEHFDLPLAFILRV
jgi:hypothetical protein